MRIPSEHFASVPVFALCPGDAAATSVTSSVTSSMTSSSASPASLFSNLRQSKLPQLRVHQPSSPPSTTSATQATTGRSDSTPTSPMFPRRKDAVVTTPTSLDAHAALSRHQSLCPPISPNRFPYFFIIHSFFYRFIVIY